MGNVESRFRESIQVGDHRKAYELYYSKKALRDSVNPKEKCYPDGTSLLHQTARHAMQPLYEAFLEHPNANPLEQTEGGQSCIHLICSSNCDSNVRENMLNITIKHRNVMRQSTDFISRCDKEGNTPLHYACASGLDVCVKLMLEAGADPTISNKEGKSPIDMAADNKYDQLAKQLETRIVFANGDEGVVVDMNAMVTEEPPIGIAMKDQEIQSMKDALIIETSELLGVSLFVAEILLRNNEWSKEVLLDSWMTNPQDTCDKAGVDLPETLTAENIDDQLALNEVAALGKGREDVIECLICYGGPIHEVQTACDHKFCFDCWRQYLHDKIANGHVAGIPCPEYACFKLIPNHVVEKLVSREMARKYLQYDIKEFVETNPNMKWCPFAGCGQAVKKPLKDFNDVIMTEREDQPSCLFVRCGKDHYFCWSCGEIGHAPSNCKEWRDWLNKVKELCTKLGDMSAVDVANAASSQWVTANSKPCPNCSVPIEKTTGCNHMKCFKCRHDFCWMCLDKWGKHNSSTGGYYECNRFKQIKKAEEMIDSKLKSEDYQLISHFKHYYERYSNHLHSLKIESQYLYSADSKMAELQQLAGLAIEGGVQFVKEAVRHLVEARHTLVASYGYAYFIMIKRVKEEFERMQGDFEETVEALAEVVARPHLRKSKSEIIQLTNSVKEKRLAFISRVEEGIRPSTPTLTNLLQQTIINERAMKQEEEQMEQRRQQQEEERQIRQAMRESTRHYHSETLLNSDTELAILLSMQDHNQDEPKQADRNEPKKQQKFEDLLFPSDLANSQPVMDYGDYGQPQSDIVYQSPSQTSASSVTLDLQKWRQSLLEGPSRWSSSSSSPTPNPSPDHTPSLPGNRTPPQNTLFSHDNNTVIEDDEELQMAIALSLSVVDETSSTRNNLNIVHPDQDTSSNTSATSSPSAALLNLLHSTKRQASDV